MKKTRRFLALLLSIMLLCPMFASLAMAEEQITLRFMWWGGDSRHKATLAAIEAFEKTHPNVKIEAEYSAYDGYLSKVMTQAASGTLPDLIQMDQPWVGSIINKNSEVFLDLSDPKYADILDLSVYGAEDLAKYCTYDDRLVGVPASMNAFVLMLNDTLLEKAGVQVPEQLSWDDLITIGNQLRAYDESCSLMSAAWYDYDLIFRMYLSQLTGKDMIDPATFSINFTKEELTQAYTYMRDLFASGATPDAEVIALYGNDPYVDPDRLNGKLGASMAGPNDWDYCVSTFPADIKASYTAFPLMNDSVTNTGYEYRPAQMFCISNTTKHPETVAAFLNSLACDEAVLKEMGIARGVPASSKAQEALIASGDLSSFLTDMLEFAKAHPGIPYSWCTTDSEIQNINMEMLQNLAFDQMSPEEAAEETIRLYEKRLESMKAGN